MTKGVVDRGGMVGGIANQVGGGRMGGGAVNQEIYGITEQ